MALDPSPGLRQRSCVCWCRWRWRRRESLRSTGRTLRPVVQRLVSQAERELLAINRSVAPVGKGSARSSQRLQQLHSSCRQVEKALNDLHLAAFLRLT